MLIYIIDPRYLHTQKQLHWNDYGTVLRALDGPIVRRPAAIGHTLNWKLESVPVSNDRGGLIIAAGTFEPNSTARISTKICWEEDDSTLLSSNIDCALLYVDDPSYNYYRNVASCMEWHRWGSSRWYEYK